MSPPVALTGCETKTAGVQSDGVRQWSTVEGDVEEVTETAEEVLTDMNLLEVDSRMTNLDGRVTAKKADGTEIEIKVVPAVEGETSEVTIWVGTTGDRKLGQKILGEIRKERMDG